jgi:ubiquinone biosynthesis monooxygenase Coq7
MNARRLSPLDRVFEQVDQAVRTVLGPPPPASRPNPAEGLPDTPMTDHERRHAAALMRVNHAGEVMAQGLYQGQALTARLDEVRGAMEQAAVEEFDHLAWCEQRLLELRDRPSVLGPVWYAGAFLLGAGAGLAGDRWSLGFVSETEAQVVNHLEDHLGRLPQTDRRSRAIVEQMKVDEAHHGAEARAAGGLPLPAPARGFMALVSKGMTRTAYWL